jgi:lipopolysaccharide transport system permease protein
VANPLLSLGVFTLVFAYVYPVRLPGAETTLSYTVWMISGYGPWVASVEAIGAAAGSVVAGAGLVKNMVFKTEVLPIAAAMTGVVPLGVCLLFVGALLVAQGDGPSWHVALIALVAAIQFALISALGILLAAATVFVRDVGVILPNALMLLLFATPIFYPIESAPGLLQLVSRANPFYILAEAYRAALVFHRLPGIGGLLYVAGLAGGVGWFGLRVFRRVKGYFEGLL